jgi:soluble lytic murein transglycosylase-like protein
VLGVSAVTFLLLSFFVNPVVHFPDLPAQELPGQELPAQELPAPELSLQEPEGRQSGALSPIFTPEVLYWESELLAWSDEWGIDPNLAATVMQIESCGDPQAKSRAGAMGLFQVMPYHFADGENPYTPNTNAYRGMAYLDRALEEFNGNARMALAGYNGGITGVKRAELLWPSETKRYAYWGSNIYQEALAGTSTSATLDEWLGSGGASLCAQASQRLGLAP